MNNKEISLNELESILKEPGYIYVGHGTGRMGQDEEIVNLIFQNGLRTKDNSLYWTTEGLGVPTPELIKQYKELGLNEPTMESLKQQLDNWPHLSSQKIIIARLKTEYINLMADRSDLDGEMYGAFYNDIVQQNGKINYYLDTKFILGCYDAQKQVVILNPNFEKEYSSDTVDKLKDGYQQALQKTKKRLESFDNILIQQKVEEEQEFDLSDWDDEFIK